MRLISGGQTGVDRAALDVARTLGLPYGGSVPKGRSAADGAIPLHYENLVETLSDDSKERTKKNVLDADGTLLITQGTPAGGSALTREYAVQHQKPLLPIDLNIIDVDIAVQNIVNWLRAIQCQTINIAGPRSSEVPGIYNDAYYLLLQVFANITAENHASNNVLRKEIFFQIYEQFNNNFRHWDSIRWTVSVGLLAFIATALAAVTALPQIGRHLVVKIEIGILLTSLLWSYLLCNLVFYHRRSFAKLEAMARQLSVRQELYNCIIRDLPFDFKIPGLFRTASFWFLVTFLAIAAAAGVDGIGFGGRFLIEPEPPLRHPSSVVSVLEGQIAAKDALIASLKEQAARERLATDEARAGREKAELRAAQAEHEPSLSKANWTKIQRKLAALHLYAGKIDGDPGDFHPESSKTRAAIRDWQASIGSQSTGRLTPSQIQQLSISVPARP